MKPASNWDSPRLFRPEPLRPRRTALGEQNLVYSDYYKTWVPASATVQPPPSRALSDSALLPTSSLAQLSTSIGRLKAADPQRISQQILASHKQELRQVAQAKVGKSRLVIGIKSCWSIRKKLGTLRDHRVHNCF